LSVAPRKPEGTHSIALVYVAAAGLILGLKILSNRGKTPEDGDKFNLRSPRSQIFLAKMSTSIRNRLPGTIERIVSDNVVSELTIRTAAGDVTSIITTGSVKRMNLKVGDSVFAIIKATEVSIEK